MKNETTCRETQEYLQEFMDDTLTPDHERRLRAHLEMCPACVSGSEEKAVAGNRPQTQVKGCGAFVEGKGS
ncbi:MAG: zf-HC2 domain-containing protein [Candidatus Methylomirabilales bacterium]